MGGSRYAQQPRCRRPDPQDQGWYARPQVIWFLAERVGNCRLVTQKSHINFTVIFKLRVNLAFSIDFLQKTGSCDEFFTITSVVRPANSYRRTSGSRFYLLAALYLSPARFGDPNLGSLFQCTHSKIRPADQADRFPLPTHSAIKLYYHYC